MGAKHGEALERQGWTHKGTAYATFKILKRTSDMRKTTDETFYDPTGLPGENHRRYTEPEWLWTPAVRRLKQLLRRWSDGPRGPAGAAAYDGSNSSANSKSHRR